MDFINVHGVQARGVKAGEPHIAHEDDAEWVGIVSESLGQRLAISLVANVPLPFWRIGRRAGHHDLDSSLIIVIVVPVRAQAYQFVVEINADAPTHADDRFSLGWVWLQAPPPTRPGQILKDRLTGLASSPPSAPSLPLSPFHQVRYLKFDLTACFSSKSSAHQHLLTILGYSLSAAHAGSVAFSFPIRTCSNP